MAIKFVVAHRADPNNVGDIASNPLQYFLSEDQYDVIDVADLYAKPYNDDVPLIVGGGGLIGNDFIGDEYLQTLSEGSDKMQLDNLYSQGWVLGNRKYKDLNKDFNQRFHELIAETQSKIENSKTRKFIWGAGFNGSPDAEFAKIRWPKALSRFSAVGIRDHHPASRFSWVPCASCMHPAFDKKYPIKNEIIWFEHKKQLVKDFGKEPIPRYVNTGSNIEHTIELLGSAEVIITNSYHGAYWGTLLGKKVVVAGGVWSGKFRWFKHQPYILDKKEDVFKIIPLIKTYPKALEECRKANLDFWNLIQRSV